MKKSKIISAWILSCFAVLNLAAQTEGKVFTLKQCVNMAIANNSDIQQKKFLAETSEVALTQSKNNLLPNLVANANHGINQGRSIDPFTNAYSNQSLTYGSYSLSSGVVLFSGGQYRNSIDQNRFDYKANTADAAQTKDNVTISVILAYLQILNNKDLLLQANQQVEVTRRQVERLTTLDKAGAVAPATFYDLKGQLANDELTIINTQNQLNQAKLTLCQLMNIPYDKNIDVQRISIENNISLPEMGPGEIYNTASTTLPLLKVAEFRRESALAGLKIARGFRAPVVSFGGSVNTNYSNAASTAVLLNTVEVESGDFVKINGSTIPVMTRRSSYADHKISYGDQFTNNYNTSLYLNVRIPILNGFTARNRINAAKITLKTAEFNEQTAKTQLNQVVEQAYFNLTAANEKVKTLQQQVADFSESFRTAEVRFNAGAITQVDYLVAKNNVDRSKANLIIAQYDFVFRSKILDYYQGKLQL